MRVIYNPKNPGEFQNLYHFNQYNLAYRIFFFFGIYLIFLTIFFYQLNTNILALYQFYKENLKPGK